MFEYFTALVIAWSVVDGDTIDITGRVWPRALVEERVRLVRIDAPEVHRPAPDCELVLGAKASEWTRARLAAAKRIEVRAQEKRDNFGRILGDVLVDGVSLSDAGLAAGIFRTYAERVAGKAWCS